MFKLYAPQYPRGLTLVISLTGLGGDVHEIDTLNHYIGMGHLTDAARFEREHATLAVALLGVTLVGLSLWRARWARIAMALGAALFPLGFIVDSAYWLHRFGHELDPRAPLHIPAFTPELFGNGSIGQFMTFAVPQQGFVLAVLGVVLLVLLAFVQESAGGQGGRGAEADPFAGVQGKS
jgi:hypothetical protein